MDWIPIPEKNGIVTPLAGTTSAAVTDVAFNPDDGREIAAAAVQPVL